MGASSDSNRRKKQHSRQIKCACSNCGYIVHTTRKWLELAANREPSELISHRRDFVRNFVTDCGGADLPGTLTLTASFNS